VAVPVDAASASTYDGRAHVVMPDVLGPESRAAAVAEATVVTSTGQCPPTSGTTMRPCSPAISASTSCTRSRALMRDLARHPAVVDEVVDIIGPNVKLMQSMLLMKAAGKPGQAWHQDESHIRLGTGR